MKFMSRERSGINFTDGPDRPLNNGRRSETPESEAHNSTMNVRTNQAIEKFLQVNPSMGKAALVDLLMRTIPELARGKAWIEVSRYFNKST